MKFMTIDPGLSGTGWAVFRDKELINWGIVRGKGITFQKKAEDIVFKLDAFTEGEVFCEWPSFQGLIAQNTGSIIKLSYLIGRLDQKFGMKLIPVSQWRGTCPKEVLWRRAEKFFRRKGFKSHSGDAVAMGQWVIENESKR
jgi:hypothetical protein